AVQLGREAWLAELRNRLQVARLPHERLARHSRIALHDLQSDVTNLTVWCADRGRQDLAIEAFVASGGDRGAHLTLEGQERRADVSRQGRRWWLRRGRRQARLGRQAAKARLARRQAQRQRYRRLPIQPLGADGD